MSSKIWANLRIKTGRLGTLFFTRPICFTRHKSKKFNRIVQEAIDSIKSSHQEKEYHSSQTLFAYTIWYLGNMVKSGCYQVLQLLLKSVSPQMFYMSLGYYFILFPSNISKAVLIFEIISLIEFWEFPVKFEEQLDISENVEVGEVFESYFFGD